MIPQGEWFGLLFHHWTAIFLEAGDDVHIRKLRHELSDVIVKLDETPFQQLQGADGSHELGHRCYPAHGIACEEWRVSFEVELSCSFRVQSYTWNERRVSKPRFLGPKFIGLPCLSFTMKAAPSRLPCAPGVGLVYFSRIVSRLTMLKAPDARCKDCRFSEIVRLESRRRR